MTTTSSDGRAKVAVINRFGDRLYRTFFKDYTEKVWGMPCADVSAEWGVQRIKGLSITKAIAHALAKSLRSSAGSDTAQKQTETSLIERFLYPKFGPGQMWEEVARQIAGRGGEIHLRHRIVGIERKGFRVTAAQVRDEGTGVVRLVPCDHFIRKDVIDGTLVRVPKACPAYFGDYRDFGKVREYLDQYSNLYPVGRSGMHRYNNQDHSMLAANSAVDSIIDHGRGKSGIWSINSEDEYHEKIGEPDESVRRDTILLAARSTAPGIHTE